LAVKAKAGKPADRAQAQGAGKRLTTSGTRRGLLVGLLAGVALVGAARVRSRRDRSRWETNEQASVGTVGDEWPVHGTTRSTADIWTGDTTGPLDASSAKVAKKTSS
jgi:hypothetical protein